jgi:hypothetical protein
VTRTRTCSTLSTSTSTVELSYYSLSRDLPCTVPVALELYRTGRERDRDTVLLPRRNEYRNYSYSGIQHGIVRTCTTKIKISLAKTRIYRHLYREKSTTTIYMCGTSSNILPNEYYGTASTLSTRDRVPVLVVRYKCIFL